MTTTSAAIDELLQSANVRPDDAPGTAAALLWERIAVAYQVPSDSPVAPLGVVDRVVLILADVVQLTDLEIAGFLNTDQATVRTSHDAARRRIGLPPTSTPTCPEWKLVRAAHRFGDPAAVAEIVEHTTQCDVCSTSAADHDGVRGWWAKRALAVSSPAIGGAFAVVPAFAAAVATAAAIAAGVFAVQPMMVSTPDVERPAVPIEVDGAPGLPTDSGPSGGVRAPGAPSLDAPLTADELDAPAPTANELPTAPDAVDDATDTVDDAVDGLVDDLTDTVDGVTPDVELPTAPAVDAPIDAPISTTDIVDVPIGGLLTP